MLDFVAWQDFFFWGVRFGGLGSGVRRGLGEGGGGVGRGGRVGGGKRGIERWGLDGFSIISKTPRARIGRGNN